MGVQFSGDPEAKVFAIRAPRDVPCSVVLAGSPISSGYGTGSRDLTVREGGSTNWGGEYPVTEVKRAWLDMAQGSARVTSQQLCVEPLGRHPESSREGALGNIPKGGAWPKVGAWGAVPGWAWLGEGGSSSSAQEAREAG